MYNTVLQWVRRYPLSLHFHFSCRNLAKLFIGGCMHVDDKPYCCYYKLLYIVV